MGRHQARLLKFLLRFPEWHTISRHDKNAIRAINHMEDMGLVQVARFGHKDSPQARIAVGKRFGKVLHAHQKEAIAKLKGSDMLVSTSAGLGKTFTSS